jgi:hypothetical protein
VYANLQQSLGVVYAAFFKGATAQQRTILVRANVILANGSSVTASETSHPDLFWALKGAGHDFGIVSSYRYKVYDKPSKDELSVADCYFTRDKLEDVYGLLNSFQSHTVELFYATTFLRIQDMDSKM